MVSMLMIPKKMSSLMVCRLVEEKWGFMSCGMKKESVGDKREYCVSRSEQEPLVQKNRYLIPVKVNLHKML